VLFEGSGAEHQTSITMEDDLAWRVFTKGILKDEARELVEIRGNQGLGEKILETVSIIA
jgi:chromosome segregation and condensation protein ScpB